MHCAPASAAVVLELRRWNPIFISRSCSLVSRCCQEVLHNNLFAVDDSINRIITRVLDCCSRNYIILYSCTTISIYVRRNKSFWPEMLLHDYLKVSVALLLLSISFLTNTPVSRSSFFAVCFPTLATNPFNQGVKSMSISSVAPFDLISHFYTSKQKKVNELELAVGNSVVFSVESSTYLIILLFMRSSILTIGIGFKAIDIVVLQQERKRVRTATH